MTKLFDLIPSWVYGVIIAALLALSGTEYALHQKAKADLANFKLEVAQALERARDQAMKREREINAKLQKAQNESKKRESNLRADADAARIERDGLRDDLGASRRSVSEATRGSLIERTNTLTELFEQCTAALEGMAAKADRHASDAQLCLDGWPK